jgi:hypothetical protein
MDTFLIDLWFAHPKLIAFIAVVIAACLYRQIMWLCGVIVVPNDSIGVVTKKFALRGKHSSLPDGSIIALRGEAGFQLTASHPNAFRPVAVAVQSTS